MRSTRRLSESGEGRAASFVCRFPDTTLSSGGRGCEAFPIPSFSLSGVVRSRSSRSPTTRGDHSIGLLASGSSTGKQSVTDQARPRDAVNPHRAGHIVLGAGVYGFSMVKSHHAAPPKLGPLFNESGKLVPTSRHWGPQHPQRSCDQAVGEETPTTGQNCLPSCTSRPVTTFPATSSTSAQSVMKASSVSRASILNLMILYTTSSTSSLRHGRDVSARWTADAGDSRLETH